MIEAASESTVVWSTKPRIAIFLSAMRHFAVELAERGLPLIYVRVDDDLPGGFAERLASAIARHRPGTLVLCEPGEWRMLELVQRTAHEASCALDVRIDTHFLCTREAFAGWARGRKSLRMEYFYRWMRVEHDVLVERDGQPVAGRWNFDIENRKLRRAPAYRPPGRRPRRHRSAVRCADARRGSRRRISASRRGSRVTPARQCVQHWMLSGPGHRSAGPSCRLARRRPTSRCTCPALPRVLRHEPYDAPALPRSRSTGCRRFRAKIGRIRAAPSRRAGRGGDARPRPARGIPARAVWRRRFFRRAALDIVGAGAQVADPIFRPSPRRPTWRCTCPPWPAVFLHVP